MKRTTLFSLLLLTLTMSTTSASAHEFIASTTGKTTLKMLTHTVFRTAIGTTECTGASLLSGQVTTTKSTTIVDTTLFEGCKAFGLNATVSPAKIRSSAEGTASMLNTVAVKAIGCELKIPSAKNQNLHTIKYKNTNKEIEKRAEVAGITSSGTGAACTYAEESNDTLEGDALVGLVSGTLEWK